MPSFRDWELCRNLNCSGPEQNSGLGDPFAFRQWLQLFKGERSTMSALRAILQDGSFGTVSQMSDDAVVRHVSDLLASGRLHFHKRPELTTGTRGGGADAPSTPGADQPKAFPLADRPASKSPARAPEQTDPSTFPDDLDGHAQAAALLSAAGQGVPFCPT